MSPRDAPDVLAGVGRRLRQVRSARGLTLAGLAAESGLSASTLSRLENGRMRPTLEQLLPLARAHGVPLDELVDAPPTGDPRVHLKPVRRNGLTYVPLTRRPGGIQTFKVIYPPAECPSDTRCKATTGTSGSTCSTGTSASSSATKTSPSARARPPSSTPGCRTGSGAQTTDPPSSSSSSAPKANGPTSIVLVDATEADSCGSPESTSTCWSRSTR